MRGKGTVGWRARTGYVLGQKAAPSSDVETVNSAGFQPLCSPFNMLKLRLSGGGLPPLIQSKVERIFHPPPLCKTMRHLYLFPHPPPQQTQTHTFPHFREERGSGKSFLGKPPGTPAPSEGTASQAAEFRIAA